jgi:1-acyl-sn-glycerol-3-phosphate acyltransferase
MEGGYSSPLRALRRILLYLFLTIPLMPVQAFFLLTNKRLARELPFHYHRRGCRILGIQVVRVGEPAKDHPVLYVANHASYFDIPVLGSLVRASFIAKAEIASWPFFSWLAKLQRSVFVDRRRSQTSGQRDEIAARLADKDDLVLFAEGTSGDGNRVLPFKSALFAVAEREVEGRPLTVQPVSITYTRLDGMPMGRFLRPFYAWYGDMSLPGHAWEALGLGIVTVVVQFHEPVTIQDYGSRKALAEHCHRVVAGGVADALGGKVGLPRSRGLRIRRPAGSAAAGATASSAATSASG